MSAKTFHNIFISNAVAAGETTNTDSAAIPNGQKCRLKLFGGYDPNSGSGAPDGFIYIQWGTVGSFTTIRAGGAGFFNLDINQTFIGNGAKFFRVARTNNNTTGAKQMAAWIEALVDDA